MQAKGRSHRAHTLWLGLLGIVLTLIGAPAHAQNGARKAIPLPADDRKVLDTYLGPGVIGKGIPAPVIDDAPAYYGLRAGTWYGKRSGGAGPSTVVWRLSRAEGESGATWHGELDTIERLVRASAEGHVEVVSEVDRREGVVSKFTPPQRRLFKGLRAGESKTMDIDVRVFDLKDTEGLRHQGSLELAGTYVGAYEVRVPAGTYEAILIRSRFKGKIGPASVEDTVYHLYAKGVGPVAFVDLKNISAMLVYRDKTKIGFVLEKAEHSR